MVDMESPLCPLSPLEAGELDSPLSEEFLREMGSVQDVAPGLGEDSSGSFSLDYPHLGSGSEGSILTGG